MYIKEGEGPELDLCNECGGGLSRPRLYEVGSDTIDLPTLLNLAQYALSHIDSAGLEFWPGPR